MTTLDRRKPDEQDASERLQVAVREYRGRRYVDLRVWFKGDRGDWLPSKKGVTVRARELAQVASALDQDRDVLEGRAAEPSGDIPSG